MKKLLGLSLVLFALSSRAAFPVFFGGTSDYATNTGPTITFVFSNRIVVTFTRGNSNVVFANDLKANGDLTSDRNIRTLGGNFINNGYLGGYYLQSDSSTLGIIESSTPVGSFVLVQNGAANSLDSTNQTNFNGSTFVSAIGGVTPALRIVDTNGNVFFWTSTNMSGVLRLGSNGLTGVLTFSNNAAVTNFSLAMGANAPTFFMGPGGNVGIRTNAPGVAVEVNGEVRATDGFTAFGTTGSRFLSTVATALLASNTVSGGFSAVLDLHASLGRISYGGFGLQINDKVTVGALSPAEERLDVLGNAQIGSNVIFTNFNRLAATNSTANTNITIDYNQAVTDLFLTNNASFTNHANLAATKSKSVTVFITPVAVNRTVVWPTLGAPSFGTYWYTNSFSPLWTTLTSGVTYALSLTTRGTNVHASITDWK